MFVVDYLISSLIKFFQKKQKVRKRIRKVKKRLSRAIPSVKRNKPLQKSSLRTNQTKGYKGKIIRGVVSKQKNITQERCVGVVTHYFTKIRVVVIKMTDGKIFVADRIRIKGRTTDFTQQVNSLQIESVDVKEARKGQLVGLKVRKLARVGDKIFKRQ